MSVRILTHIKRCPGCNKEVESSTGAEAWHDDCWRGHRGDMGDKNCTEHGYCKRALKRGWW